MAISKEKKSLLHVGKQKLDLTDQEYREILRQETGRSSSADPGFTDRDFKRVVDHFRALGFWIKRPFEQLKPRDAGELPTVEQLAVISHLWEDLSQYKGGAKNINFRRGFYEKRLRIPALGPQTRKQANVVIESLKNRVMAETRRAVQRRQNVADDRSGN